MGAGRILLLFAGTAASVGGATVLWVSSLTPHDVPFVAPVHPQLVQREEPVVATPLPAPHAVLKKKVKHAPHVAPEPAVPVATPVVPTVTPVVRHVTPAPPSKPKPVVPPVPAPTPTPSPPPTPTPTPATTTPTPPVAAAPVVTTTAQPTETTPTTTPPPPTTTPDDNSKPGNGYGDQNHDHTGPPGQNKEKGK